MRTVPWRTVTQPEEVARLREELYRARRVIISLAPAAVRDILTSYYAVESTRDASEWVFASVERIIALARPIGSASTYGEEAVCPLCGDGSSDPYSQGFKLPEGLRRHLTGSGNTRECDVMAAASELARGYAQEKFGAAEAAVAAADRAQTERRRRTETVYRLGPKDEPVLLDELWLTSAGPRNASEMRWAEARITSFGLTRQVQNNVVSYVRSGEGFVVYADPRAKGAIEFRVYRVPSRKGRLGGGYSRFTINDRWKNNLAAKFEQQMRIAVEDAAKRTSG